MAVGFGIVVELSPVGGAHVYVVAPAAVITALDPVQMVGELAVTVGKGLTITVLKLLTVQPEIV